MTICNTHFHNFIILLAFFLICYTSSLSINSIQSCQSFEVCNHHPLRFFRVSHSTHPPPPPLPPPIPSLSLSPILLRVYTITIDFISLYPKNNTILQWNQFILVICDGLVLRRQWSPAAWLEDRHNS